MPNRDPTGTNRSRTWQDPETGETRKFKYRGDGEKLPPVKPNPTSHRAGLAFKVMRAMSTGERVVVTMDTGILAGVVTHQFNDVPLPKPTKEDPKAGEGASSLRFWITTSAGRQEFHLNRVTAVD